MKKINVALVGLGFGGCFADIYIKHPNVGTVKVYDTNKELEKLFCDTYGIEAYGSFEEILADENLDAVHLVTPIPLHAEQTVAVLNSGKHCACTVPMATSLEDLQKITDAVRRSGKNYMMMETTLYTYQYFYVKEMLGKGEIGKIQFLRGSHYQDMSSWPDYWLGLPPMWYGTHAIAPMIGLSGSRIKRVNCFGSGTMDDALVERYGNPFPVESALFELESGMKGEATRTLFETAHGYQEGMFVYGSEKSFIWSFTDGDYPYIMTLGKENERRGKPTYIENVRMPDFNHLLPPELRDFTKAGGYDELNPQECLKKGAVGGHHGSHPHLVHEFVMSIVEERKPWIDEVMGANITAAGICAHISAMNNGESVTVPEF